MQQAVVFSMLRNAYKHWGEMLLRIISAIGKRVISTAVKPMAPHAVAWDVEPPFGSLTAPSCNFNPLAQLRPLKNVLESWGHVCVTRHQDPHVVRVVNRHRHKVYGQHHIDAFFTSLFGWPVIWIAQHPRYTSYPASRPASTLSHVCRIGPGLPGRRRPPGIDALFGQHAIKPRLTSVYDSLSQFKGIELTFDKVVVMVVEEGTWS